MAPSNVIKDVYVLGIRGQVVFPFIRNSITMHPQTFAELSDHCAKFDKTHIGVVALQPSAKGKEGEEPYKVGTYCRITSHAKSSTKVNNQELSVVTLAIEGQCRFRMIQHQQSSPVSHTDYIHGFVADVELVEERKEAETAVEVRALVQNLQQSVVELLKQSPSQENPQGAGSASMSSQLLRHLLAGGKQRLKWPTSPSILADMVAAGLGQLTTAERQQVLETEDVQRRLEIVLDLVRKTIEVQRVSKEISSKMQKRTDDELREAVLRRQLQDVQRELRKLKGGKKGRDAEADGGDESEDQGEDEDDVAALTSALQKAGLSADAQKISQRELRRLQNIQPHHPEYTGCRTYLETLAGLPWQKHSEDGLNLASARGILDKDHYGLEKVKKRILEFLAVQKMRGDMKGPILCLHGPPGVGKTSLGRSVAKALNREFHRIALGGVRDEAELRGHRRTYIGAMPGAIIQALQTCQVNNPVILLDEIDKMTRNAMFNPSGAMLELLDPEQNHTFKDHYLNTPFDLSRVLFLCTCNDLAAIDRPLLDRMEVIDLAGYTVEEKIHIASNHLVPKQRKLHALERRYDGPVAPVPEPEASEGAALAEASTAPLVEPEPEVPCLEITRGAVSDLITKWTAESGVRSLERKIAQVCRWAALRITRAREGEGQEGIPERQEVEVDVLAESVLKECGPDAEGRLHVDARHLPHIVGIEMFEPDLAERLSVGVSMGLAVTSVGGALLFVEASRCRGSGRLTVTGQLGDVMKESVSTAMSLLRSKLYHAALAQGKAAAVNPEVFQPLLTQGDAAKDLFGGDDIHVHFPAGSIPKDGPSAGVATTLALASLLLGRPVRSDTAVTGEITLRGHVLAVGGIRDKVLAASRAGVRHVLLPFANKRHVKEDLPKSALGGVEIHYVKTIDEALAWAFAEPTLAQAQGPTAPGLTDAVNTGATLSEGPGRSGAIRARL
eukprot:TRINITY_DN11797_c0_g1_i1.p1 TRINITY_DN11797_c0_g1~~TRINITY_DN11797_c0_g1_i1.p1  ORF type:complete len:956 (+),score=242.48 TRINITY_DN11797_c0_g1_i1:217-3084(+)